MRITVNTGKTKVFVPFPYKIVVIFKLCNKLFVAETYGFAVIAVVLYAFPLTARYEESYKQTIVNSIRLALGNLFVTIFFAVLLIVPADLALHNGHVAVVLFSILIFCGGAALAAFFSLFFMRIFEKAEK